MDLDRLLQNQREYFRSGATLPVDFRVAMLKKLRDAVERHEEEIAAALKADLGKSNFEGFMCETGLVKSELSYMIRHTHRFAPRAVCIRRWRNLRPPAIKSRLLTEMCSS